MFSFPFCPFTSFQLQAAKLCLQQLWKNQPRRLVQKLTSLRAYIYERLFMMHISNNYSTSFFFSVCQCVIYETPGITRSFLVENKDKPSIPSMFKTEGVNLMVRGCIVYSCYSRRIISRMLSPPGGPVYIFLVQLASTQKQKL